MPVVLIPIDFHGINFSPCFCVMHRVDATSMKINPNSTIQHKTGLRNSRKLLFSVDHYQEKLLSNRGNIWHWLLQSCKLFTSSSYLPSLHTEKIMVCSHKTYFSDQRLISFFNILLLQDLNSFKMHVVNLCFICEPRF